MPQPGACSPRAANTRGKLGVLTYTTRTLLYGTSASSLPKFPKYSSMITGQSVTGTTKPPTSNIGNNLSNASLLSLSKCKFPHAPQIGYRRDDAVRKPTPWSPSQASRTSVQIRTTHHLSPLPPVGALPSNPHRKDRHPHPHVITNTGGTMTLSWWGAALKTRSKFYGWVSVPQKQKSKCDIVR